MSDRPFTTELAVRLLDATTHRHGTVSYIRYADAVRVANGLYIERHPEPAEDGRRDVICELREFADDLYGITGARWIAEALTSTLDRLSEDGNS